MKHGATHIEKNGKAKNTSINNLKHSDIVKHRIFFTFNL